MRSNLEKNVLAAPSYSDIFDYPLTQTQIHKFLVGKKASRKDVEENLKKLSAEKKIDQNREFYFLPKREKITETRIERELISQDKLKIAKKTARILRLIPNVKFVGISGALACKNSQKEDDIDFFIIRKRNVLNKALAIKDNFFVFVCFYFKHIIHFGGDVIFH